MKGIQGGLAGLVVGIVAGGAALWFGYAAPKIADNNQAHAQVAELSREKEALQAAAQQAQDNARKQTDAVQADLQKAREDGEAKQKALDEVQKMLDQIQKDFDAYKEKYKAQARASLIGTHLDSLEVGGKTYTNVFVKSANAAQLYITHDSGACRIDIGDMGDDWKEKLAYDPAEAAAALSLQAKDDQAAEAARVARVAQADALMKAQGQGVKPSAAASPGPSDSASQRQALQAKLAQSQAALAGVRQRHDEWYDHAQHGWVDATGHFHGKLTGNVPDAISGEAVAEAQQTVADLQFQISILP